MSERVEPQPCPNCRKPMRLVRVIPRVASLPELESFECRACGEALTQAKNRK